MLSPDTRALLTDALQPPDGYRVDAVVTTTYSLDLTALLLAPLSLAARNHSENIEAISPLAILDSLRRHTDSMTVFCQAGAIRAAGPYRSVLSFAEDAVVEVQAPTAGRLFHPKIWLIRFENEADGGYLHRLLCSSRNLTFDASWDTLLMLDEDSAATAEAIDAAPLAAFLAALPSLAVTPMPATRKKSVLDVASTVRAAQFSCPAPFTGLTLHPLGMGLGPDLPIPDAADRALVISPFFDVSTARMVSAIAPDTRVVSRAATFDAAGADAFAGASTHVLHQTADRPGEDEEAAAESSEITGTPSGLHAKTFVFDTGRDTLLITGSANATGAGLGGNVEFSAALRGRTDRCGVAQMWDGVSDSTGFGKITEPYTISSPTLDPDATALARVEMAMADFRARLAAANPELRFELLAGGVAHCALVLPESADLVWDGGVDVTLVSLHNAYQPLAGAPAWRDIAAENLTPFLSVRTRRDGIERVGIIKAALVGNVAERDAVVLRKIISTQRELTQYLLLLLGGNLPGDLDSLLGLVQGNVSGLPTRPRFDDATIFEPLVRAVAAGDSKAIVAIDTFIRELGAEADVESLVNDELRDLLDAARAATMGGSR
ncbi:phospholipase D family protein [Tomitella biformata]|uniref:phospholipase D family protein n=1 Tax=Tomitella biformata TaxID=630403 RepID=UPI000464887C|nr:phospholipase D family protein [Tomitella biformata]